MYKLPPFFISWSVCDREAEEIINWRVGDAQSTVLMQDGTCALARGMIHMSTPLLFKHVKFKFGD